MSNSSTRSGFRSGYMMCYTADPLEFDQMMKTLISLCNSFKFSDKNVEKRIVDVAVEQVVCVTISDIDYVNALLNYFHSM